MARNTEVVQSFRQRLVPFAPSKASKPAMPDDGESVVRPEGSVEESHQSRPKTPYPHADNKSAAVLRLYPSKAEDEKVAMAAFDKMFQEEQKALMAARQELPADVPKVTAQGAKAVDEEAQDVFEPHNGGTLTDPLATAGVGRINKALPVAPTGLRRIKTGQVKTVTVAPPRPPKRANTSDIAGTPATASALKVKTGPLFRFAGVGGAKTQEFEIVSGGPDGAGQAF